MKNIEKREKYYLIARRKWEVWAVFHSLEELLNGLRYYAWKVRCPDWIPWKQEYYLDIGHNKNDNCEYVVFDIHWRVVSKEFLQKKMVELGEPPFMSWEYNNWWRRQAPRKFYRYCRDENYPGFRNGPVPHAGNYRGGSRGTPRLRNEVLADLGTEKELVRAKRSSEVKDALVGWDHYHWRRKQCWKHNTKKRKQWM